MKKYILPGIAGCLSTYSLITVFHPPIYREYYVEGVDYITANIYELLGEYSFSAFIVFALCLLLFYMLAKRGYTFGNLFSNIFKKEILPFFFLSLFFGFSYTLGKYYNEAGTNLFRTGSFANGIKFVFCMTGFFLLCFPALVFIAEKLNRSAATVLLKNGKSFWEKHAFTKAFLILFLFYLPFCIISFPGNLCYDVIGQIEQVLTHSYSSHHPLLHTLLVGGMTALGKQLFSSYEIGLFLYILIQSALLIAAFSTVIAILAKKKVNSAVLWGILFLYCFTPIYTNLATTALKDVPYTAFVLLYIILYSILLTKPEYSRRPVFHLLFVISQIGTITMRNNGLPLVILCGTGAMIYLSGKAKSFPAFLRYLGLFLLEGILISQIILIPAGLLLHAEKGSKGEILSLPFQQTSYYLNTFDGNIPKDELSAIEGVLGDPDEVMNSYDETIADPVKAHFKKDASTGAILTYIKAYFKGGIRHPFVYAKAFFIHTYGWYCPNTANEIRYETDYETIKSSMLHPLAGKGMIFLYRFAHRAFPFGLMENPGFAFWLLAFLTAFCTAYKKKETLTLLPYWIGFLVCLASPCFLGHPRYALPLLAGLPFSYVLILISQNQQTEN